MKMLGGAYVEKQRYIAARCSSHEIHESLLLEQPMYNHYTYMSREVLLVCFVEFHPINEMLGFHLYYLPVYNFVPIYDVFFFTFRTRKTVSILVEVTLWCFSNSSEAQYQ